MRSENDDNELSRLYLSYNNIWTEYEQVRVRYFEACKIESKTDPEELATIEANYNTKKKKIYEISDTITAFYEKILKLPPVKWKN